MIRVALLFLFIVSGLCLRAEEEIPLSLQKRLESVETVLHNGTNPPGQPTSTLFVTGEALYWTAREQGAAYVLKESISTSPERNKFQVKELEYDWDFGFRIALGCTFRNPLWDLSLTWTRFFTQAQDSGSISPKERLIPIWANPNFLDAGQTLSLVDADWSLHYNQLDLPLGYLFYVSRTLLLRPYLGLSALELDQDYQLKHVRVPTPAGTDRVKLTNHFKGIGLSGGCDLLFSLGHGWALFGRGSASLYYGSFHLKLKEKFLDLQSAEQHFKATHNLHMGAPAVAMAVGLRWERSWAQERCFLRMKLLWENLLFFEQNQLFRFVSPSDVFVQSNYVTNQGDLTLQGATFSLTFGF